MKNKNNKIFRFIFMLNMLTIENIAKKKYNCNQFKPFASLADCISDYC